MLRIDKADHIALRGEIELPPSKSISNRFLIIKALAGTYFKIKNLSNCNDTKLLQKALDSSDDIVDFEDAGTPMRFFIAYAALRNLNITITGNEGLRNRPIGPLIEALSQLGCQIEYIEKQGFLPVKITEGIKTGLNKVILKGDVSSQFISALLLIGPCLSGGLSIEVSGSMVSKPYIDITVDCMLKSGVKVMVDDQLFYIPEAAYSTAVEIFIESDWSAAAFFYAITACTKNADIFLKDIHLESIQGDRVITYLFEFLGVRSKVENNGIRLSNSHAAVPRIRIDFTAIPDAFPAIAATCAFLKIAATFSGIKNLVIKESNRLHAMKQNLEQTGAILNIEDGIQATLTFNEDIAESYKFDSFDDHRIAMACSLFALRKECIIENEKVVEKSFPEYWNILKKLGFLKNYPESNPKSVHL